MKILLFLTASLFLLWHASAHGQDATWNLNPISNDWNTPDNWTPASLPTGTATFDVSSITDVSIPAGRSIENIVFNPGASAFTISADPSVQRSDLTFIIQGNGITNNSGSTQHINALMDRVGDSGTIMFTGNATIAGSPTIFTTQGHPNNYFWGSTVLFEGANAGNGIFHNGGATVASAAGGLTTFYGTASAGNATFIVDGGTLDGAGGAGTDFWENSNASNALITGHGGTVSGAGGAVIGFNDHASLGNATIIAKGGRNGGGGAAIWFGQYRSTDSNTARVELFGNGIMYVEQAEVSPVHIGSVEGDGLVAIGNNELMLGYNDLATTFSGIIDGAGHHGRALTKVGQGTLTLSGANTYAGQTTVSSGALVVANSTGSATGAGAVLVDGGAFGGNGFVDGSLTIGIGQGPGALLAPGINATTTFPTLRIQGSLAFKADGTYGCRLSTRKLINDNVMANEVMIASGAQIDFTQVGNTPLPVGTVFTLISNTSVDPINGTFANLANGSTFKYGRNNYQVNYEGGDGNDLTLTVVP